MRKYTAIVKRGNTTTTKVYRSKNARRNLMNALVFVEKNEDADTTIVKCGREIIWTKNNHWQTINNLYNTTIMNEDAYLDNYYESLNEVPSWYDDDLEMMNQNEADDYRNEGYDDMSAYDDEDTYQE